MTTLFIINDAPYGTEKAYNALRMAHQLVKEHTSVNVRVFLMADAVGCGIAGQKTPDGYYNIERMLRFLLQKGAEVHYCGSCADTRGIGADSFLKRIERGTMPGLTQWTVDSEKILTF